MRIAFTFNVKPAAAGAEAGDRYAEWEDETTIAAVEAALSRAGTVIRVEATDELPPGCTTSGRTSSSTSRRG